MTTPEQQRLEAIRQRALEEARQRQMAQQQQQTNPIASTAGYEGARYAVNNYSDIAAELGWGPTATSAISSTGGLPASFPVASSTTGGTIAADGSILPFTSSAAPELTASTAMSSGGALSSAMPVGSDIAGMSTFGQVALPIAGAYGAYNLIDKWGQRKPLESAMSGAAAGAAIGSFIPIPGATIIGAIIGGIAGGAVGFIKTGKHEDQMSRDLVRKVMQENGFLDQNWNLELADGSTYNIGIDGGPMAELAGRRPHEPNEKHPMSGQAAGWVNPIATIVTGGKPGLAQNFAGYFVNAVTSNADTMEGVRANVLKLYEKLGINQDAAVQLMGQLKDAGKITQAEYEVFSYGVGTAFQGDPKTYIEGSIEDHMANVVKANNELRGQETMLAPEAQEERASMVPGRAASTWQNGGVGAPPAQQPSREVASDIRDSYSSYMPYSASATGRPASLTPMQGPQQQSSPLANGWTSLQQPPEGQQLPLAQSAQRLAFGGDPGFVRQPSTMPVPEELTRPAMSPPLRIEGQQSARLTPRTMAPASWGGGPQNMVSNLSRSPIQELSNSGLDATRAGYSSGWQLAPSGAPLSPIEAVNPPAPSSNPHTIPAPEIPQMGPPLRIEGPQPTIPDSMKPYLRSGDSMISSLMQDVAAQNQARSMAQQQRQQATPVEKPIPGVNTPPQGEVVAQPVTPPSSLRPSSEGPQRSPSLPVSNLWYGPMRHLSIMDLLKEQEQRRLLEQQQQQR